MEQNIKTLIAQAKSLVAYGLDPTCPNIGIVRALAALDEPKADEEARYPSTVLFGDSFNMEALRGALRRALDILAPAFLAEHPTAEECLEHFPVYKQDELPKRTDKDALTEYLSHHLIGLSIKQIAAIASMTLDVIIYGLAYADGLASLGHELRPGDSIAGAFHTSRIGRRKAIGLK